MRPVCLLESLSKVTEKIIIYHLNVFISNNNIIIPKQFEFRTKDFTSYQLLKVIEFITGGLKFKRSTGTLLDLVRAFNCIWHADFLYKLISLQSLTH